MLHRIQTIDAHAAGEPLRLVTSGFPTPVGETMHEKRDWAQEHCDVLRRALMHEPRGHADMYGAVLTEPCTEAAARGRAVHAQRRVQHHVRSWGDRSLHDRPGTGPDQRRG